MGEKELLQLDIDLLNDYRKTSIEYDNLTYEKYLEGEIAYGDDINNNVKVVVHLPHTCSTYEIPEPDII